MGARVLVGQGEGRIGEQRFVASGKPVALLQELV